MTASTSNEQILRKTLCFAAHILPAIIFTCLARAAMAAEWSVPQLPLPTLVGQTFPVEDFNAVVTERDTSTLFSGNSGPVNNPDSVAITTLSIVPDGSGGGAQRIAADLSTGNFGGMFMSLNGLTDTLVSLDGSVPTATTKFPGYSLNFNDFFPRILPWKGRSIEVLALKVRAASGSPLLRVRYELKDELDRVIYCHRTLTANWTLLELKRADFSKGAVAAFDWTQVSMFSIVIEKVNVADRISNPSGAMEVDDIAVVDQNGIYPSPALAMTSGGALKPQHMADFLRHLRRLSAQYFADYASTDSRTGGIALDRASFADLISVGSVPFQVGSYIALAEGGEMPRTEAAAKVLAIVSHLADGPQGPQPQGQTGYRGFFYHFFGINGRRKLNHDFPATSVNESLNTVELSTIDTTLALLGVTLARQYFNSSGVEEAVRQKAELVLGRVEWPFMLHTVAGGRKQFALGWKPIETRVNDEVNGRFLLLDALGEGQYSSKFDGVQEVPATLDFYTTEGQLVALMAMSCPNPAHRITDPSVFWDMERSGVPFVKTYPGSIFTYKWLELFVNTRMLGADAHPVRPVDWFANSTAAFAEARAYGVANPLGVPSLAAGFSGFEPCEGPFDNYRAQGAASMVVAPGPHLVGTLEWEDASGPGAIPSRSNASGTKARHVTSADQPATLTLSASFPAAGLPLNAVVRYSNEGALEMVDLLHESVEVGDWQTVTAGSFGSGWDIFHDSPAFSFTSVAGVNELSLGVAVTDSNGVEFDSLKLYTEWDQGTQCPYGVASQLRRDGSAELVAQELARLCAFDLFGNGTTPLLHPRQGLVDAFQIEVADAYPFAFSSVGNPLRLTGKWRQQTGFAIDHGPIVLSIDNLLSRDLIPALLMADPQVDAALAVLFPARRSAFQQWLLDQSLTGGAQDESDGDGVEALLECYLGRNGSVAEAGLPVFSTTLSNSGATRVVSVRHKHDRRAVGVAAVLEVSTDLLVWDPLTPVSGTLPLGDGMEEIRHELPHPGGTIYLRLTATEGAQTVSSEPVALGAPVITPPTLGTLSLSSVVDIRLSASPAVISWSISGALPPGLAFDSFSGRIFGRTRTLGSFTVKVRAKNAFGESSEQTLNFVVEPLVGGLTGSFVGRAGRDPLVTGNQGARLDLQISAAGFVSGKLRIGVVARSISGWLDAHTDGTADFEAWVTGFSASPLKLLLNCNGSAQSAVGTLSHGGATASVDLWRNPWSPGLQPLVFAGHHTIALRPPPGSDGGAAFPQGSGFGSFKIGTSKPYAVTVAGKLPDGSAYTSASFAALDGRLLIYQSLYKQTGSVLGTVAVATDGSHHVGGALAWTRPPIAGRLYPRGFQVALVPTGGLYPLPQAGQLVMGLGNPPGTARLMFESRALLGTLPSPNVDPLTILKGNAAAIPSNHPRKTRLTISASSGAISGSFVLVDAHPLLAPPATLNRGTVKFYGQIIEGDDGFPLADGFFLVPELPTTLGAASEIVSGSVRLLRP